MSNGSTAWTLAKDTQAIKVYTAIVDDSDIRKVRAEIIVDYNVISVIQVLRDHEARIRWESFAGDVFTHKSISPTEEFVYSYSDLPWPVSDREMLMHVQWHHNLNTGVVTMESKAVEGMIPPHANRIRVIQAKQSWRLTPVGKDKTEVVTEVFLDPAGPLPAWLLNRLSVQAPYNTLQKIAEILQTGDFKSGGTEFIE